MLHPVLFYLDRTPQYSTRTILLVLNNTRTPSKMGDEFNIDIKFATMIIAVLLTFVLSDMF